MMKIDDQQMLPIGTLLKLGEYRVMRYIASGGFGNTYEVEHVRLGKRLALKEFFMRGINMREGTRVSVSLEDNRQAFSQMREKFYKEAQRLARLEEQHIVEVTDFFEENATAYYVMKLIVGFIDKAGKVVIPCHWEDAGSFNEGLACVEDANERWGFIDKSGKVVIPCQWTEVGSFNKGIAYVKDDNDKYGFIDMSGRVVIPCQWEYAGSFNEGLACVNDGNDKFGFIDKSGKVVIPCNWKDVSDFCEGLARVKDDYEMDGFIDKSGKVVIPCRWRVAWEFSEGLAHVDENYRYGFIDKSGKVVISCQWESAGFFNEGLAPVKDSKGKWGFVVSASNP